MNATELALLITALSGAIVALLNGRNYKHELDETKSKLDEAARRISELEAHRITDRRDIILIGESLAQARADNAIMAKAFNSLWEEFFRVTGHKPEANLDSLKQLQTVQYITGKLEPINPRD